MGYFPAFTSFRKYDLKNKETVRCNDNKLILTRGGVAMKYRTLMFSIIAPFFLAGITAAETPDLAIKSAVGIKRLQNQGNYKEAKVAMVWGDHLKPPVDCPRSIINLREAMLTWTRIPISIMNQMQLSSPDINKLPILIIAANEPSELSEIEKKNLREYIRKGGFIVADGDLSLLQMIRDIAGNAHIVRIPADHPIYQTPFLTGGPVLKGEPPMQTEPGARMIISEEAEGLLGYFIGDRLVAVYSPKGYYKGWQSNQAAHLKFGVNLIMYAIDRG
jgi:hypothetical protein